MEMLGGGGLRSNLAHSAIYRVRAGASQIWHLSAFRNATPSNLLLLPNACWVVELTSTGSQIGSQCCHCGVHRSVVYIELYILVLFGISMGVCEKYYFADQRGSIYRRKCVLMSCLGTKTDHVKLDSP